MTEYPPQAGPPGPDDPRAAGPQQPGLDPTQIVPNAGYVQQGQPGYGGGPGQPGQPGYGGQPYGGQPGYGGQPYGWPPVPPRGNRNVIVAAVVAVVLIAGGVTTALLVTGGDGKKKDAAASGGGHGRSGSPTSAGGGGAASGGAAQAFSAFVSALNSGSQGGVRKTVCPDATGGAAALAGSSADLGEISSATTTKPPVASGDYAAGVISIASSDGESEYQAVTLHHESGGWCVSDLSGVGSSESGGSSTGGSAGGASSDSPSSSTTSDSTVDTYAATAQGNLFFSALDSQNLPLAQTVGCSDARVTQDDLDRYSAAESDGDAVVSGDSATQPGTLTTTGGTTVSVELSMQKQSSTWCVESVNQK